MNVFNAKGSQGANDPKSYYFQKGGEKLLLDIYLLFKLLVIFLLLITIQVLLALISVYFILFHTHLQSFLMSVLIAGFILIGLDVS